MAKAKPKKPKKPFPDFALTAHPNGQWCKKIRGKVWFFGKWDAPQAALEKYRDERDDLQAGRQPRRLSQGKPTTGDLVNAYLARCDEKVQAGELAAVTFNDYKAVGKLIIKGLGRNSDPEQLRPVDFATFRSAMARKYASARLTKIVVVTRAILRWAHESELIDKMPRFGPDFSVAGKSTPKGEKLLSREDVLALLEAADVKWKAMLLLAINGGFGNSDLARVKIADVAGEWLEMPRGKTGVDRRIPLWPETQAAIKDAIRERPEPQDSAKELIFLSARGGPLITVRPDGKRTDLTVEGFRRLAKDAGIYKPRMGLYWCRHVTQTRGDAARDPVAVAAIMGHKDPSMAGHYRQTIEDERLLAVVECIRAWLWPKETKKKKAK